MYGHPYDYSARISDHDRSFLRPSRIPGLLKAMPRVGPGNTAERRTSSALVPRIIKQNTAKTDMYLYKEKAKEAHSKGYEKSKKNTNL